MKLNKNKIGDYFLNQKDIHLIYLIKKGNLQQKVNNLGDKVIYPQIQLKEKSQFIDCESLHSCIVAKLKNKRNTSLPLFISPISKLLISGSAIKENKLNFLERHERRSIDFRNNKINPHKKECQSDYRNNRRTEDKDKIEYDLQESECKNELLNNRKELNIIKNRIGVHTVRRKINVRRLKNEDQIHKFNVASSLDKAVALEDRQIHFHCLYKSLIEDKDKLLGRYSDFNNSKRKEDNQSLLIKNKESSNSSYFKKLSKTNSVERSIQTINSSKYIN